MNEKGCPNCGRIIYAQMQRCPYCNYDFTQINDMFNNYKEENKIKISKRAGFIKRVVATNVDFLLLSFIFALLNVVYIFGFMPKYIHSIFALEVDYALFFKLFWIWFLYPIVYFLYCVFLQRSKRMGTFGESLLGIEIVNAEDNPIELGDSFKRNIARVLNMLTFGIGFLMIIFSKEKQALSDVVSRTYVNNKLTSETYTKFSYAGFIARILAFIIDAVIISLLCWTLIYGLSSFVDYITKAFWNDSAPEFVNIIYLVLFYVILLITILYFPYFESHQGATFGKKVLRIKVTDINGKRISFFRALFRTFCLLIELMIPFGLLLIFITPRKQTLKDIMSKTMVLNTR